MLLMVLAAFGALSFKGLLLLGRKKTLYEV